MSGMKDCWILSQADLYMINEDKLSKGEIGSCVVYTYGVDGRKPRGEYGTVGYTVSMPQTSVMRQDVTEQTRDAFTVSQTYDSCGSVEYINGRSTLVALLAKNASRLRVDGGFVSITGTPVYYYNLQDHLGSNRAVLNASGTLVQTD